MERTAILVFSILFAMALLFGAAYGAILFLPVLDEFTRPFWAVVLVSELGIGMGAYAVWRKRKLIFEP